MRRATTFSLSLALACVVLPAAADPPAPAYSSLPVAHLAKPPDKAAIPEHVNGHPRIEGVFVVTPTREDQRQMASSGYRQVQIFTSEKRAKDASAGRFSGMEENTGDACLVSHQDMGELGDDWSPSFQTQASVSVSRPTAEMKRRGMRMSTQGGVEPVRFEKLARESGKVTLDGTTALVDPDTAGVKLFERSVMPLALIAKGPAGIEVYAARDEGIVHFVVTAPKLPEKVPPGSESFARSMTRRMMAELPIAFRNGNSDCGHFRATLRTEKGGGQMVSVQATTLQPSDEPPEAPNEDGTPPQFQAQRTMKKRSVVVNLSVSQSSTDKEPVLSVSFGWVGKESDQPFLRHVNAFASGLARSLVVRASPSSLAIMRSTRTSTLLRWSGES